MRTNEEIISLIDEKRKEKGLSISELSRKVGMAKSGVSRYFNGTRTFPLDRADEFAKALNMETSDLLGVVAITGSNTTVSDSEQVFTGDISGTVTITGGDTDTTAMEAGQELALKSSDALLKVQETGGDVRNEILDIAKKSYKVQLETLKEVKKLTSILTAQNEPVSNETDVSEELYSYQVYERLSAGTGSTVWDDGSYDTVYFDEELNHDIASWIWGDSMEPAYQNGEVALIKKTGFDYDGAVYAVVWDGQTYIKKVYREEDGLRLVSLNKKYRDKFASYEEEPRVIGLVTGHFMPMEK